LIYDSREKYELGQLANRIAFRVICTKDRDAGKGENQPTFYFQTSKQKHLDYG
jgi:hypothetical protein